MVKMNVVLKRAGVVVLTALLSSAFLAGCAGGSSTSESSDTSAGTASDPSETDALKVALVLPGSISDASWNAGAYQGLEWLKENRDDVDTAYVENVSADKAEATLINYAEEGYQIIFVFAAEFVDAVDHVAESYPDIYFADTDQTDTQRPANVAKMNGDQRDASFLVGVLAAYLSETNRIGTVEGFESADLSANTTSFIAGAKYVNPEIETVSSYVGSWSDIEKAKQTTLAQIESGVGFIYASGDSIGLGIIEAAKEKNIPVVGYGTDLNELAPEQVVSSVIWNVGITFDEIVEAVKNGTFESRLYAPGLKEGAVYLADYHGTVPEDIQQKVEEVKNLLISGELSAEK